MFAKSLPLYKGFNWSNFEFVPQIRSKCYLIPIVLTITCSGNNTFVLHFIKYFFDVIVITTNWSFVFCNDNNKTMMFEL